MLPTYDRRRPGASPTRCDQQSGHGWRSGNGKRRHRLGVTCGKSDLSPQSQPRVECHRQVAVRQSKKALGVHSTTTYMLDLVDALKLTKRRRGQPNPHTLDEARNSLRCDEPLMCRSNSGSVAVGRGFVGIDDLHARRCFANTASTSSRVKKRPSRAARRPRSMPATSSGVAR
jgi:hypothetical protein